MNQNTRMLLGAVVAAVLAIAVYYGFIGQQTANNIQTQANQTLGTTPATQQPAAPGASSAPTANVPTAAPAAPAGQSPAATTNPH